jgi:hypothetical protein
VLNADIPHTNDVEAVLLLYLKVRYILYMVVGKPISSARMRGLIDNFKMVSKGSKGVKADMMSFMSHFMRKPGHTAESWVQEMDIMTARSGPASQAYWLRFMTKYRGRREAEVLMGRRIKISYEVIRYIIEQLYEEDLAQESLYRTKHMHTLQAVETDEENWSRIQQQQQQYQDAMDQQLQVQQSNIYAMSVQQQQQQQAYPQQQMYAAQAQSAGIYGPPPSATPDQVVNGRTVWLNCDEDGQGCGLRHPQPRGRQCNQRMVDAAGNPTGRWAKYGGWNLELLASMRPEVAGGVLKRMSMIAPDKAIPAHLMEEAKEEIRQIRNAAPPGAYRANGRK